MVKNNDGLLRLFWPSTLAHATTPGVIVGWKNAVSDLFVITVLEDVEIAGVELAFRTGTLFRGSRYPMQQMMELCGRKSMSVLGTYNYNDGLSGFNRGDLQVHKLDASAFPHVLCSSNIFSSIQVILYDAPDPTQLQYLALDPIDLTLSRRDTYTENVSVEELEEQKRVAALVTKLRFHTVVRHKTTQKELTLPYIIRQINCATELANLLQRNTPFVGPRRRRLTSMTGTVVERAQSLYTITITSLWSVFMLYLRPAVALLVKLAIMYHRVLGEGLLAVLELEVPVQQFTLPDTAISHIESFTLKDISAACQQIHLRLQQFSYYPIQYTLLRRRHATWSSTAGTNADYIRYYNSLWLVANDMIIGMAVGAFIIENSNNTADWIAQFLNRYTIDGLRDTIRWLMSYPGGLKLNTELAAFLGDLFLWVIEYWSAITKLLIMPHLERIVFVIGFSAFAGATMPIAIFSDLMSLMTMHIYCFYVVSARIFNWQLSIIISLFQLFRGKKRNVLRNRIDNCDYDLDQLLLGTILFTLLFFLLPTVGVFYLTFASARMAIITFKAILDASLAFLNHFPLFALMLKIKDSRRLPGGVHFELLGDQDVVTNKRSTMSFQESYVEHENGDYGDEAMHRSTQQSHTSTIAYIRLSSTPISLRQIFSQYSRLGARIRGHYLSPKVVLKLLTGRFVPPFSRSEIYGLQYSVLPRKRATIKEVWAGLFSESGIEKVSSRDPFSVNGHGVSDQSTLGTSIKTK